MRPCILTCWRFYLLDAGITDPPPPPWSGCRPSPRSREEQAERRRCSIVYEGEELVKANSPGEGGGSGRGGGTCWGDTPEQTALQGASRSPIYPP